MSKNPPTVVESVFIGREHWDVPLRVELRSYLAYIRRIDSQLRRLVIRWSHTASPAAKKLWDEPRGIGVERGSIVKRRSP